VEIATQVYPQFDVHKEGAIQMAIKQLVQDDLPPHWRLSETLATGEPKDPSFEYKIEIAGFRFILRHEDEVFEVMSKDDDGTYTASFSNLQTMIRYVELDRANRLFSRLGAGPRPKLLEALRDLRQDAHVFKKDSMQMTKALETYITTNMGRIEDKLEKLISSLE
jgi:hypothetical protein